MNATNARTQSVALLRIAGVSELAGALRLLLPAGLRIKPMLTPLATALLTLVTVLAAFSHIIAGDFAGVIPTLVLGSLIAFIAWGRLAKAPITAK